VAPQVNPPAKRRGGLKRLRQACLFQDFVRGVAAFRAWDDDDATGFGLYPLFVAALSAFGLRPARGLQKAHDVAVVVFRQSRHRQFAAGLDVQYIRTRRGRQVGGDHIRGEGADQLDKFLEGFGLDDQSGNVGLGRKDTRFGIPGGGDGEAHFHVTTIAGATGSGNGGAAPGELMFQRPTFILTPPAISRIERFGRQNNTNRPRTSTAGLLSDPCKTN
jgi:hypothetical protein